MTGSKRLITGYIRIIRVPLASSAAVCALAAALLSGHTIGGDALETASLVAMVLTVFFLASGTMPLNDLMDISADRINAPDRPLPSGMISPGSALAIHGIHSLLGLIVAVSAGLPALIFSAIIYINSSLYSLFKKRLAFIPNLQVSFSVAAVFLAYPIFAISAPAQIREAVSGGLLPVILPLVFLISLQLELAGDILDARGDGDGGGKSIAVSWGLLTAKLLFAAIGLANLGVSGMILTGALESSDSGVPGFISRGMVIFAASATALFTPGFIIATWDPVKSRQRGKIAIISYFIFMTMVVMGGALFYRIAES